MSIAHFCNFRECITNIKRVDLFIRNSIYSDRVQLSYGENLYGFSVSWFQTKCVRDVPWGGGLGILRTVWGIPFMWENRETTKIRVSKFIENYFQNCWIRLHDWSNLSTVQSSHCDNDFLGFRSYCPNVIEV